VNGDQLDLEVVPRVSPNPMAAGTNLLWIAWFPEAKDDNDGEGIAGASPVAARRVSEGVP